MRYLTLPFIALGILGASACGNSDNGGGGTAADRLGIGAECRTDADCPQTRDGGVVQHCLTEFKGGYCGLKGCTGSADCPQSSACVAHDNGQTYCFRQCADKAECNVNRSADALANCSSSIAFVETKATGKACVPPSGG